jgi:hypothetical protein
MSELAREVTPTPPEYEDSETIAVIPLLFGEPELITSSPEVYRRVLGDLNEWNKVSSRRAFSE